MQVRAADLAGILVWLACPAWIAVFAQPPLGTSSATPEHARTPHRAWPTLDAAAPGCRSTGTRSRYWRAQRVAHYSPAPRQLCVPSTTAGRSPRARGRCDVGLSGRARRYPDRTGGDRKLSDLSHPASTRGYPTLPGSVEPWRSAGLPGFDANAEQIAEGRRKFYVSITRARDEVYDVKPCPFIAELRIG